MRRLTLAVLAAALITTLAGARIARAQLGEFNQGAGIAFRSGQEIQPFFDGWSRNADGSFEFHFGYLNRNFAEELHVPVGPDNSFDPGPVDRGQPTYFYPRFNRRVFSVTVPKDWGNKKELVWTVVSRGKTERAFGWMHNEWEIDPVPRGADRSGNNKAPTISVTSPGQIKPGRIALTAKATDDGLPPPAKAVRGGNSENPPGFRFDGPTFSAPINVPEVARPAPPRIPGLSVRWSVHRGPAAVVFEPSAIAVKDGEAVVAATFTTPGEYVLRARATDTALTTIQDVKVIVAK